METKIFVMTHKKWNEPTDPVYIPLHVGKVLHEDLGYQGDDTQDQISAKNPYYGELTGLYWVAHNVNDADYLGLCHYRRYFLNDSGNLMTKNEYETCLQTADIILPIPVVYEKSYYEVYEEAHNIHDLEIVGKIISQLYPYMYEGFCRIINGHQVYSGNLFVTSAQYYKEYTDWLFSIFSLAEKEIDVSTYDEYHKRVYGFLSEQLLYVWVDHKKLKICEKPIGLTQEKAETIELKEHLRKLMQLGNQEAVGNTLTYFRSVLEKRPDVMLPASDINGDLEDLFRIIYICDTEYKEEPDKSMLRQSSDLVWLLAHYRKIESILLHAVSGKMTDDEAMYLMQSNVSQICLQIIINQHTVLKRVEKELLELLH